MSFDDSNNQQSTSPSPNRRRSSFTSNKLSEMFSSARNPQSNSPPGTPHQGSPTLNQSPFGNSAQATATAAGRRISISTLGLSGQNGGLNGPGSAGPNSANGPANMWGFRRGSYSAGPPSNASSDESAIDDAADISVNGNAVNASGPSAGGRRGSGGAAGNVQPGSPFGRRMSFGARAMGQMRGEGQGFNWADNLRTRQSRSGSTTGGSVSNPMRSNSQPESMAQPPSQPPAPREPAQLPRREPQPKKPDHFQERILKGDFYMD